EHARDHDDQRHQRERPLDVPRVLARGRYDRIDDDGREQHGDDTARGEGRGGPLPQKNDDERNHHRAVKPREDRGRDKGIPEPPEGENAIPDAARDRDDSPGDPAREITTKRRPAAYGHWMPFDPCDADWAWSRPTRASSVAGLSPE